MLPSRVRRGFTLIELLVVIAIIAVLVAILLPAVQQAREAARASNCRNNLKQYGIAMHSYAETHSVLPMGEMGRPTTNPPANNFSFQVMLLPFLDQAGLYNKFNFSRHYDEQTVGSPANYALKEVGAPYFLCPSGRTADMSYSETVNMVAHVTTVVHYYGVAGAKGTNPVTGAAWPMQASVGATADHGGFSSSGLLIRNVCYRLADATDGLTNTLLMGEISSEKDPLSTISSTYRPWTQGSNTGDGAASYATKNVFRSIGKYQGYLSSLGRQFNDAQFSSQHTGGAHFLLGDGAVKFLSDNIDFATFQCAASKDEGANLKLD